MVAGVMAAVAMAAVMGNGAVMAAAVMVIGAVMAEVMVIGAVMDGMADIMDTMADIMADGIITTIMGFMAPQDTMAAGILTIMADTLIHIQHLSTTTTVTPLIPPITPIRPILTMARPIHTMAMAVAVAPIIMPMTMGPIIMAMAMAMERIIKTMKTIVSKNLNVRDIRLFLEKF